MRWNSLKTEQLKFLYNKWIILTIISLVIFIPVMAIVLNKPTGKENFDFIVNQILQSFYLGQSGFTVISVFYFGQEFLNSTLRTSFLSVPNRFKFMTSKVINLVLWETLLFFIATVITIITVNTYFDFSITDENILILIKSLIPVYIVTVQLSLIAISLTSMSSSIVVSLAILLSMILGLGQLLLQFSKNLIFLPVLSVMNAFSTISTMVYPKLESGIIIQGLWSISLLFAAYYFIKRRVVR
ncbi:MULTISPECIES: ABC transporter permease [Bacillota]|uniref:ABC transporter permease n=1 Tax=Bacillota TaxID=1239 RepID=UPI0023F0413B|nr:MULTISPECIES: ABC transporter permease [Bacillota]MDD7184040.1 ABC transporter permease [Peptostreptococcus porci]MDY3050938.1 ABC transporter permease [Parvimonas sp.]